MSQRSGFSAKTRNHQWRRSEQPGTPRVVPRGHGSDDSLYEDSEAVVLSARLSRIDLSAVPMAVMGGRGLESEVKALIDAMAVFAPSAGAQTTWTGWNELALPSLASPLTGLS